MMTFVLVDVTATWLSLTQYPYQSSCGMNEDADDDGDDDAMHQQRLHNHQRQIATVAFLFFGVVAQRVRQQNRTGHSSQPAHLQAK